MSRSIERAASTFRFPATERFPEEPLGRKINLGEKARVRIGDDLMVTGWVDKLEPSFDGSSHGLTVGGRSLTGDLVDCSPAREPGQWKGRKLERIAAAIAKPFDVEVVAEVGTGRAFDDVALEGGSAYREIKRLAELRALLVTDDEEGRLVLTRVSSERMDNELRQGQNILRASATFSDRDRFSEYRVVGQRRSSGNVSAEEAVNVHATALDPNVARFRPLRILAGQPGDAAQMKDRAQWEANVRAGRATRAVVTVQGWRTSSGQLWKPNRRVFVRSEWLGINREMLITSAIWSLGEGGTITTLELSIPEAFDLLKIKEGSTQLWPSA